MQFSLKAASPETFGYTLVYLYSRPVSPGFVQQIIPNVYVLPKDITRV
jgi:hypothetical protein